MSLTTFAQQALVDFRATAAVAPSSRFLARAMIAPLPLSDAEIVVELGPGTGAMTRLLLDIVPADARVLAFEINPRFVKYLREDINDPRLEVIEAGAETAGDELRRRGYKRVDAVLSSLGLGMMPEVVSREIIQGLVPFLDEKSGFTQSQYMQGMRWSRSNGNGNNGNGNGKGKGKGKGKARVEFFDLRDFLGEYFSTVQRSMVWRNLPPAKVIFCQR